MQYSLNGCSDLGKEGKVEKILSLVVVALFDCCGRAAV